MDFVHTDGVHANIARPCTAAQAVNLQDARRQDTVIGPFRVDFVLSAQQQTILERMAAFYTPERIDEILRPALTHGAETHSPGNPSLRCLDWLTVNFAKKHRLITTRADGTPVNVYANYRVQLHTHRRRLFDPFRRRLRLTVEHPDGALLSTVGQLHFLWWSHVNGVLEYARKNVSLIEADMNAATTKSRAAREDALKTGKRLKRNELSRASASKVMVFEAPTVLKW